MRTDAARFGSRMDEILEWLDFIELIEKLTVSKKESLIPRERTNVAARRVIEKGRKVGNALRLVPFEGAYLTCCAEYELCVRTMIESAVLRINSIKPSYTDLPDKMKKWHPDGCAYLMQSKNRDRFSHIAVSDVAQDLSNCLNGLAQGQTNYVLTPEAFSYNSANFRLDTITRLTSNIGLTDLNGKLGNDLRLQQFVGVNNSQLASRAVEAQLKTLMDRRNDVIHRGRLNFAPSKTDVREAATFFKVFAITMGDILETHTQTV